jgi:hypothetical protein
VAVASNGRLGSGAALWFRRDEEWSDKLFVGAEEMLDPLAIAAERRGPIGPRIIKE